MKTDCQKLCLEQEEVEMCQIDAPGIESECYLIHSKQHSKGRPTSDPADFLLNMT